MPFIYVAVKPRLFKRTRSRVVVFTDIKPEFLDNFVIRDYRITVYVPCHSGHLLFQRLDISGFNCRIQYSQVSALTRKIDFVCPYNNFF